MKQYNLAIEHPEWGHHVNKSTNKYDLIKKASDLRRMGNSWTDSESPSVLSACHVVITDGEGNQVYCEPFTKKYIAAIKSRRK